MREELSDRFRAALALATVALIWGSTPIVGQFALAHVSVPLLLALRFSLALLCFAWVRPPRGVWGPGARLGLLMFAVYSIGLPDTTPAKSGFIMGSSVLLVPLLSWGAGRGVALDALGAAALGVLGLGVMLLSGSAGLGVGDAWQLLAAVLLALYVRSCAQVAGRFSPPHLALPQLAVMAACAWLWAAPHLGEWRQLTAGTVGAALYLGVGATGLVMLLQSFALRHLPAERAALWLLLEPVLTLALAALLLGTVPGWNVLAGGVLVLLALVWGRGPWQRRRAGRTRSERELEAGV